MMTDDFATKTAPNDDDAATTTMDAVDAALIEDDSCGILEFDDDDLLDLDLGMDEQELDALVTDEKRSEIEKLPSSPPSKKKRPMTSRNDKKSDDEDDCFDDEYLSRPAKRRVSNDTQCSSAAVSCASSSDGSSCDSSPSPPPLTRHITSDSLSSSPPPPKGQTRTKCSHSNSSPPQCSSSSLPSFASSPLYAQMLKNLSASMRRTEEDRLRFSARSADFRPPSSDDSDSDDDSSSFKPTPQHSPRPSAAFLQLQRRNSLQQSHHRSFFEGRRSTLTPGLEVSRRMIQSYRARMNTVTTATTFMGGQFSGGHA